MKKIAIGLGFVVLVVGIFFWKVLLFGKVAFPGDVLVGMYYPWLTEKYGYEVGVPVKNPMLSDPVSQDFVWKSLIAESFKKGELPLWNPYSYSGYPLLANFQSGALYPFNLLMVWLGDIRGWNWLMISGVLGSAIGMYLYLVKIKLSPIAGIAGAITYSFSSFAMTWMTLATGAQVMVWLPFLLLAVELFAQKNKLWLILTPAAVFLLITAGQAHIGLYGLSAVAFYAWWKLGLKNAGKFILVMGLGGLLATPLLLQTIELSKLSVRNSEVYISSQRWGLIPAVQLITGIAVDFFGNPATGNHWGWWQYHETVFYAGVSAIVAIVAGLLDWKKLGKYKFFVILAIAGLALGVDWPVGQLVYKLRIPILGTGSAGRVFVLYSLGAAVMTGWWVDRIKHVHVGKAIKAVFYPILVLGVMVAVVLGLHRYLNGASSPLPETRKLLNISLRNSIFPFGLLGLILGGVLFKKKRVFGVLAVLIIILDLFRTGWKYLPFVDAQMIYPDDAVTTFLKENTKGEVVRIDRERAEVMPPNTWAMYRLSSPSGYDPLAVSEYVVDYERELNGNIVLPSRYTELTKFDAAALGKYNVKYLLSVKRDDKGRIPGDKINYKIDEKEWKRVFESPNIVILENSKLLPRARMENGKVEVTDYHPGKIKLRYDLSKSGERITVADAYYPGWRACEDKQCQKVKKNGEGFMEIEVKKAKGEIEITYKPESFKWGMVVATLGLVIWGGLAGWLWRK